MTDIHDDFDETIQRAAEAYNRPPATVPRDDMWAAIQARRAAPVAPVALVTDRATAAPPRRRGLPARAWWGMAAAASVLLASGIGIGRWTSRGWTADAGAPATVASTSRAPAGTSAGTSIPSSIPSSIGAPPVVAERSAEPVARTAGAGTTNTRRAAVPGGAARDANAGLANANLANAGLANARGGDAERGAGVTYTLATLRHLTQVEALLVSYRSEAADSAVNARISTWARDLVADTRLLLDSPAAADPRRRRLLEDLEMVLVQLVQLDAGAPARAGRAGAAAAERDLIDRSLGRGQLLTRLRGAIPAGT